MKKSSLILIFLASITFHSCDLFNMDNDPALPDITQQGKGTFGCLIDGELFLPKGPDPAAGMRGNPHARYTEIDGTIIIKSQNIDSWKLNLKSFEAFQVGDYILEETTIFTDLTVEECDKYQVDTATSSLTISFLDTELDIISGLFSGRFINECDSTNILTITEGRFDLVYTL